jgi:hypothetical protein
MILMEAVKIIIPTKKALLEFVRAEAPDHMPFNGLSIHDLPGFWRVFSNENCQSATPHG